MKTAFVAWLSQLWVIAIFVMISVALETWTIDSEGKNQTKDKKHKFYHSIKHIFARLAEYYEVKPLSDHYVSRKANWSTRICCFTQKLLGLISDMSGGHKKIRNCEHNKIKAKSRKHKSTERSLGKIIFATFSFKNLEKNDRNHRKTQHWFEFTHIKQPMQTWV